MKINPLDDRVVVRTNEAEETTAAESFCRMLLRKNLSEALFLLLGPGRLLDSGQRAVVSVEVGDEILFGKYGGTDIEVDGEEVKILRESDILAKVV